MELWLDLLSTLELECGCDLLGRDCVNLVWACGCGLLSDHLKLVCGFDHLQWVCGCDILGHVNACGC